MAQHPPVSVRLPGDVSAALDELAEARSLTRHAAIIILLRAALFPAGGGPVKGAIVRTRPVALALPAHAKRAMLETPKGKRLIGYDSDHTPIYR